MKVKIAGFNTTSYPLSERPTLFDHEPSCYGWVRVTEWAEVEIPNLMGDELTSLLTAARELKRNELKKKLAELEGA